jgi:peptidoglycan/LPS O-acetylase OafA/YrhL
MSAKQIPSLNGLRAISIAIVIIFHAGFRNLGYANFPGGQLGVNIFFIISGFLITLLLIEEEKVSKKISLKKFYLRRIFRIFPAYYFLLFTYYILQVTGVLHFTERSWIEAGSYSEDIPLPKADDNWEMGHLWSLSVEEHFYLLWPIIFKFLKAYRVRIAMLVIFIVPVIRGIEYSISAKDAAATIFERADAIMLGCLLAIYYWPVSRSIDKYISKYKFAIFIPFIGFALSVVGFKILQTHNVFILGLARALGRADGTLTNIFICMIIIIAVNYQNSFLYRLLNFRIMNYTGKISYSLYIWQQIFFSVVVSRFLKFPFNILCILAVAVISYHLIEKPFLKLKERFEPKRVRNGTQTPEIMVENKREPSIVIEKSGTLLKE